jgi:GNAT superfamily N-acetyltransferase
VPEKQPAYKIRVASPDDAEAVAALVTLAYRVEDFFITGDRTDTADIQRRMQVGVILVLEVDGTLVGAVFVQVRGRTGYFGMLSVDPASQGQGLGKRLIDAAEEWCRTAGCTEMEIEVVSLRTELPPFYERLGYVFTGTRPFPDMHKSRMACAFLVMEKALRP